MFTGLGHHAIVTGDHQQRTVDAADARQHIGEKLLMARYVDKPRHAPVRLRPVGVAEVNGHATLLLFRQPVGVDAGERLQQRGFAVVDVPGSCNNHFNNLFKKRDSSSRQRRSSHRRPSEMRPMTGCGSARHCAASASRRLPRPSRGVKVSAALGSLSTGSEPLPICDWQAST